MRLALPLAPEVPYSYSNTQRRGAARMDRGTDGRDKPAGRPGEFVVSPWGFRTAELCGPTIGHVWGCEHE